ncbi:MAG: class I SAM-dependent methyltransferase [Lentimicrobiaceae bacterium]|nr:class I SAM-dependent methyltransferase [Lentimicrobiaceae bacterium]
MKTIEKCPICNNNKLSEWLKTKDYFLTDEEFVITQCESCGFKFTNPQPEEENLYKYYETENYISHSQKNQSGIISKLYNFVKIFNTKSKYKTIKKYIDKGSLLDIGAGNGYFANYMKTKNWQVDGVEPNITARKYAQDNFLIELKDEDFLDETEHKKYDVITMWHVLEHVSKLSERITQISRLIKNNGKIFIAVPNINSKDAEFYKKYWAGLDTPRHLWHFSEKDIKNLLQNTDLQLIKTKGLKFDSFYISIMSEKNINKKGNIFRAIYIGLISNLFYAKKRGYSSMIYILAKKSTK